MPKREPDWEWYRAFLHVLETGSLSAAGRAMGLTQPTVGRHIINNMVIEVDGNEAHGAPSGQR